MELLLIIDVRYRNENIHNYIIMELAIRGETNYNQKGKSIRISVIRKRNGGFLKVF